ncbi:hypothetical protein BDZ89DRAFT_1250183 [Hymenopellis radicata]|nr:hypothetical protein BDZ89DRAFT_1250183 [Hymenopellis radicata]
MTGILPQGRTSTHPKLRPGKTRTNTPGWMSLSLLKKRAANAFALGRNMEKWDKHLSRRAARLEPSTSQDTQAEPDPLSSLESLLSTENVHGNPSRPPSPEAREADSQLSPGSFMKRVMDFSPGSLKTFTSLLTGASKRQTPDEPESPLSAAKKMKLRTTDGEVDREPGAVRAASDIHPELFMLAKYGQYVPIHIFSSKNRKLIWSDGDAIAKKKLGVRANEKHVYVMDVASEAFGKEEDLGEAEWRDAIHFFLEFIAKTGNAAFSERWINHFDFFILKEDVSRNFKAYLRTDIKLRKQYRLQPFTFSRALYTEEVRSAKDEIADEEREREREAAAREKAQREAAERRRLDSAASGSSGSRFRGGSSFRAENSNTTRESTCLICARKGHRIQNCSFGAFEDGKPTFAILAEKGMRPRAGGADFICIGWNLVAASIKKCTHSSATSLLHVCSFCGSTDHHAFAWRCRNRPT